MPQMGESIFEGTITKWLKKVGDAVEKDEPLFEISTDKVDAEIPAPVAGVLTEIRFSEGATVEDQHRGCGHWRRALAPAESADSRGKASRAEAACRAAVLPQAKTGVSPSLRRRGRRIRFRSSPLVRRIAKENNLDLAQIAGTGSAGRITKEDVLKHLSERGSGSAAGPSAPAAGPATAPAAAVSALPGTVARLAACGPSLPSAWSRACAISPHVHTVYKVDMTRIVRIREREKADLEQQQRRQAYLHAVYRRGRG